MIQGISFVLRSADSIVGIYISYPDRRNFHEVYGSVRSEPALWSEPSIEISRSPSFVYERMATAVSK